LALQGHLALVSTLEIIFNTTLAETIAKPV